MGCIDCESGEGKLTDVTFDRGDILTGFVCERWIIRYVADPAVVEIDRVRLSGVG